LPQARVNNVKYVQRQRDNFFRTPQLLECDGIEAPIK
jgi:hypothetical protein